MVQSFENIYNAISPSNLFKICNNFVLVFPKNVCLKCNRKEDQPSIQRCEEYDVLGQH